MDLIQFKYHPNVWKLGIFREAEGKLPVCDCCGTPAKYYLEGMYAEEEVECICPRCVASGKAARMFDGTFIEGAEDDAVEDEAKREELYCRTPGYDSWQGEVWLACCKDYCAFIDYVGTPELEEMGIADQVFAQYEERGEWPDVRDRLERQGSMAGYLFQCLHCGEYHLWVDMD